MSAAERMSDPAAVPEEDRLRADLYNYLGLVLSRPADGMVLAQTAGLSGDASDLGRAIDALAEAARTAAPKDTAREFQRLFIGLGRGELLPFASFYLTGFLNEKPLASLRTDLAALGLRRSDGVFEPEDGIASLMETMGALIAGRFGRPQPLAVQKTFWTKHVGPWAGHFFDDLAGRDAPFHAAIGRVGAAFMAVEREAFRLTPN